MIAFQDILFKEAAKVLQKTSLNSKTGIVLYSQLPKKLPKQSFYTYVCMYYIGDLQKIKTYIQLALQQGTQDFNILLKALWSISLSVIDNSIFSKSIEAIYRYLMNSKQLRELLIKSGFFPTRYQQILQKKLNDQSCQNLSKADQRQIIIVKDDNIDNKINDKIHQAKLALLISQLDSAIQEQNEQNIWKGIVQYLGKYNIDSIILIDLIITITITTRKFKQFVFLLSRLKNNMEPQLLIEQLMLKYPISSKNTKTNQAEAKPLGIVMKNYSTKGLITHASLTALALMVKHQICNWDIIFNKLTPSVNQLNRFCNERSELHNELLTNIQSKVIEIGKDRQQSRSVWDELIECQKLKLLTQIIMVNSFTKFRTIINKLQLKIDYIYHTPLYFAISQLYQWAIDPLLQKIEIEPTSQNQVKKIDIIQGDLKQFHQINEYFFSKISELFSYGGCFMFARRSTFSKTCLLFIQICKANKNIAFQGDQDHKKSIFYIFSWLKKYIISSLQFYNQDQPLYDLINALLCCFKFNLQITVLFDILRSKTQLPLQLTFIMWETSLHQKKLLNRISNKKQEIITKQILRVLQNQPLSSMKAIFIRLLSRSQNIIEQIVQIILQTHHFVKKVMIVYLFLYLTQDEDNLVNNNGSFSQNFQQIISFMQFYIFKETNSGEMIKMLIDYLVFKLKPLNESIVQANKFQFFHTQITFFYSLFRGIIPYQDMQGSNSNFEFSSRTRAQLWGGPYLKIAVLNKGNQFMINKKVREAITINLLNKLNPLQSNFYRIINKLFQRQRQILESQYYNISHSSFLIDQINVFVFNLIEIVSLESNTKQTEAYFNFLLMNSLLNVCFIPYQVCFAIVRKDISNNYTENNINWREQKNWKTIKNVYYPAIENYIQNSLKIKKMALQKEGKDFSPIKDLQHFMKHDLFLFFWLSEPKMFINEGLYRQILNDKKQQKWPEKDLQTLFKRQLQNQESSGQRAFKLFQENFRGKKNKNIFQNTYPIFQRQTQDLFNFIQQFIRTCIIPRSLLSKADAYFSWKFFFNLLIRNSISIPMITKLTCKLRETVCDFIVFGTKREVTQLLPILSQSSDQFIKYWHSRHILSSRFQKYQIIGPYEIIPWPIYNEIKDILRQSYKQIISKVTKNYSQMFTVRNSLTFIFQAQFIPMFKNQTKQIYEFIDNIIVKYVDCEDIILLANRTKQVVEKRNDKTFKSSRFSDQSDNDDKHSQASSKSNRSISPQFSQDKDFQTASHISISSEQSGALEDVSDSYLRSLYKNDNLLNSIMEQREQDLKESACKSQQAPKINRENSISSCSKIDKQSSLSIKNRL